MENPEAKGNGPAGVEKHYTPEALAELLAVEAVTIRRWIKAGRLKAVRIGRALRIPASAVEGVMADARALPPQLERQGRLLGALAHKRALARHRAAKATAKAKRATKARRGR